MLHQCLKMYALVMIGLGLLLLPLKQLTAQEEYKIRFEAESIVMDKSISKSAKRLIGNVVCKHQGAVMYSDSAYYYSERNALDAYNNVHINQGDTLHLYADTLQYNGNTQFAKSRGNVKLVDQGAVLRTPFLNFDRRKSFAYYEEGGRIVNDEDTLTSRKGYYYSDKNMAHFKDSVVLHNPDYTIYTDTMKYNTREKTASFYGPTHIIGDSNVLYCEKGWYNTEQDIARFSQNPYLQGKDQLLRGDSLYYERDQGYGEAFESISLYDSARQILLRGEYGHVYEQSDSGLITDRALFTKIGQDHDSLHVHGDTIRLVPDTMANHKVVKAYHGVRIYKSDLQGVCDSLTYTSADSTIRLFSEPVLWSGNYQLSARFMEIYSSNNQADSIKMYNDAIIIEKTDSLEPRYNQIQGKQITAYIDSNQLRRLNVEGNAKTVFYPEDEDGFIGINKAVASSMTVYIRKQQVNRVTFITKPEATLYPLHQLAATEKKLEHFEWLHTIRPLSVQDLFH